MPSLIPDLLVSAVFPRVEDPWPHSIGVDFPFAVAGAFGAFMGFVYAEAPREEREQVMIRAGVRGFRLGVLFYACSLVVQVASRI